MFRFKPRISLRMFLLVITVLAVWLGLQVARSQRQQAALVAFKSAVVIWDYQLPDGELASWDPTLSYAGPRWLAGPTGQGLFSHVRGLIASYGLSKEAITKLPDLSELETLTLSSTGVSDEDVVYVARLKRLRTLNLEMAPVTDDVLRSISTMMSLEHLALNYTGVTDEGILQLASLRRLKTLSLEGTSVTAAGAEKLQARLPGCRIVFGPTSTPQGEPIPR